MTPEKSLQSEHVEGSGPKALTELEVEDIFAENLAYGPDGVRGLIGNSYVFGAAFLASLGGFSFGYDQGVISIINVMDQFRDAFPETKTAFGTSFMTAMLLLGAFIGCIFMPYLADRISRKWALTVVVIIFDIGAITQTAAQSYGALVAGRAIGGIGVGTLAMVCKHLRCKVLLLCGKLTGI
jgi:MFS family permease